MSEKWVTEFQKDAEYLLFLCVWNKNVLKEWKTFEQVFLMDTDSEERIPTYTYNPVCLYMLW